MNEPSLSKLILRAVSDPRWGGGVHRSRLAEIVVASPRGRDFNGAIHFLYQRRLIDFCGPYVVTPSAGSNTDALADVRKAASPPNKTRR